MTITLVGTAAVPTGNPTTSFTVGIQSQVVANDILILSVTNRDADAAPSVTDNDTGGNTWARLESGTGCLTVWWKRATSATASKTITVSGLTGSSSGVLCAFNGCRLGTPYEAVSYENNASANESHAAITTSRDGAWVVLAIGNDSNDLATDTQAATSPSTITERGEKLSTGGSDCSNTLCAAEKTTAGSTGTITWAQVDGASCSCAFALVPAVSLTTASGSFALTGNAASTLWAHQLAAASGSFALTGADAGLARGFVLAATAGSFTLTGSDATLTEGGASGETLTAESGSFALTGSAASLLRGLRLPADSGAFAVTGNASALLWGHRLVAANGAFALSGTSAGTLWGHRLSAALGAFALSGSAATFQRGYGMQAGAGDFALVGSSAALRWAHQLVASVGSLALTGAAAGLARGFMIPTTSGAFALTGAPASFLRTRVLSATPGVYVLSGNEAVLVYVGGEPMPWYTNTMGGSYTSAQPTCCTTTPNVGGVSRG